MNHDEQIQLVNLKDPQIRSNFNYNKKTTIVDLLQYINKNFDQGKVEIHFTKNQLFSGNLNLFLYKQLQGSSVYYNIDVSQKQIQPQYVNTNQENQKQLLSQGINEKAQSKTPLVTSYYQKSDQFSQTDETQLITNGSQQMNKQQLSELQFQIQQLTAQLAEKEKQIRSIEEEKEKERQMKRIVEEKENQMKRMIEQNEIQQKDLYVQIEKNEETIKQLIEQNTNLQQQLNQFNQLQKRMPLDQKKIENLQSQIEQLKIEVEVKNKNINSLMQKQQNYVKFEEEIPTLHSLNNNEELFQFNDHDQEATEKLYLNKCRHNIEKNKLEQLLNQAVMNKKFARCQICNSHFSSKLCQEFGIIGKQYLDMKSALELPDIFNSCKALQSQHIHIVSCENPSCKFFCIWRPTNQNYENDSFCPNCLMQSIKNPKGALFYTQY